jgi:hypothetical protein
MKRAVAFIQITFIVTLLVLLALPEATYAMLFCRSDPAVILSNGMTLDIGADISTLVTEVTEVHYELHVPAGVTLVAAIGTPNWLTTQETFTVFSDQAPRQYSVTTTVYTTQGDATVTADTTLVSVLGLKLGHYTAAGTEGEALTVSFHS